MALQGKRPLIVCAVEKKMRGRQEKNDLPGHRCPGRSSINIYSACFFTKMRMDSTEPFFHECMVSASKMIMSPALYLMTDF